MRGIFWIIDDSLVGFAFKEGAEHGVAKSGVTFNHKAYWNWAKPAHSKKPYNYYPRGRVDYTNQGKPIIFMNPHVDEIFVSEIIEYFELEEKPIIKYDCSEHYKCYLDR